MMLLVSLVGDVVQQERAMEMLRYLHLHPREA
jgi:hypothetical protein